jgi:plasmid replication initiation protein
LHRFSWINKWKERADAHGHPLGLELIVPDWFYTVVLDDALVLTIDRAYFDLTGGLERWLYRLVPSMVDVSLAAGASISGISMRSRAASRRSSISRSIYARSSAGRHCQATRSPSSVA